MSIEECSEPLAKVSLETDQGILMSEQMRWGLPIKEVYKHALTFFKDKDGKAVHLSYEDRLKLVAYTQQASHGPFDQNSVPAIGVLDVIGRDRHAAWQLLGNISQVQAITGFVHTLDRLCPLFSPFIEAISKDSEGRTELNTGENGKAEVEESNTFTEDLQVRKLKDALNRQTSKQFEEYAQQHFPGNSEQQAALIRQLQDQHYQQYMQQLAINQNPPTGEHAQDTETSESTPEINENVQVDAISTSETYRPIEPSQMAESPTHSEYDEFLPAIAPARLVTRDDLQHFKRVASSEHNGKLTISPGECVTIRVPTHDAALAFSFEFATDDYDLGFGLIFEWGKSPTNEVTINFSDTDGDDLDPDDEEDSDEAEDCATSASSDAELGNSGSEQGSLAGRQPPHSVLIPTSRRDCHTEVYSGRHAYPGDGVYILKFDNTYSLWRSKVLYYKIFYSA